MIPPRYIVGLVAGLLAACQPDAQQRPAPPPGAPRIVTAAEGGPPGAPPGSCWGRDTAPAVVETVTEQVLVRPAETDAAGRRTAPPVYRSETRQEIVAPRRTLRFETPCPAEMDAAFVAALQRALAARGLYRGPIDGAMDARSRAAVRRYQAPRGLDSGLVSLETARALGLVVTPVPD